MKKGCILFITIICVSCKFLSFTPLEHKTNVDDDILFYDKYSVIFSEEILPSDFEKYASLKNGSTQLSVDYFWTEKSCQMAPKTGWILGERYEFSFSGEIHTPDGRKYSLEILENFSYKTNDDYLTLIEEPPSVLECNEKFILKFNSPPDKNSFYESFSLNPVSILSMEFTDDGKTLCIFPKSNWKVNSFYEWKLKKPLLSTSGKSLEYEKTGFFKTTADFSLPQLTNVLIDGIGYDECISMSPKARLLLIFNTDVDFFSINNGIKFSPTVSGNFYKKTSSEIEFIPDENFKLNTEYVLTCTKSLTNPAGIRNVQEKTFYLPKTENFMKISEICINQNTVEGDTYEEKLSFPSDTKHSITVLLQFSLPKDFFLKANPLTYIDLQPTFPAIASSPILTDIAYWDLGKTLRLTFENLSVPEEGSENYYTLEITGGENGIFSDTGHYLEDDICILLKFSR